MAALKQTVGLQRLSMTGSVRNETLAFVSGPTTPKLWNKTLGQLIDEQAVQYEDKTAALFPWQSVQLSYRDLSDRSRLVARAMLSCSLHQGDRIGIMAGNCFQYIEAFLAAGRIGCPYVVMNNTYSPQELANALSISSCRLLFLADHIGPKSLANHLQRVEKEISNGSLPHLKHVVKLSDSAKDEELEQCASSKVWAYSRFVAAASGRDKTALHEAQGRVRASDTLNLQFTSGTTGDPKAAMLTHNNLINNGRFVGIKMHLTPTDIVACPPPLFHCFGLVMGFLSTITHGSTIVFPCDQFDAGLVLDALYHHKCTAVLGVPTMFISMLEANEKKKYSISTVRTGLAAGSSVPAELMRRLEQKLGIRGMLIAYGMTETSPVTFLTSLDDTEDRRTKTVGQVMPHTAAKVIKPDGETAPRGTPGELCTSGYALQQGYWNNEVKTREAMRTHEDGVLWMHTGDECVIDNSGYCSVTGRIKDIIIRGGENIYPSEIEERLLQHRAISEACVVAIKDVKYGEVVGAFLKHDANQDSNRSRPSSEELFKWVSSALGSHKSPKYCFWIGDRGVGQEFPRTGSGKYLKHVLRATGEKLVASREPALPQSSAKL